MIECRYWHFHRRAYKLQLLFLHWKGLKCKLMHPDRSLTRDVNIIAMVMLGSTVLKNFVNNLRYCQYRSK